MSNRTYVIDRFEDNGWTVLERDDSQTFNVPSDWLPDEAQEGHVLDLELDTESKESRLNFVFDSAATEKRRQNVEELRESLPKGPEGDFEL